VPQKPDLTLVEAATNGDADSFTELCRHYYPGMVAIAHSVLGDRHLAEDAAQQAFAKAARRLPQLRKKGKFAGWLAVICRNAARDMARTAWAGPRACPITCTDEDLSMIAAESHQDGPTEAVKEAISKLSAFFMRFRHSPR